MRRPDVHEVAVAGNLRDAVIAAARAHAAARVVGATVEIGRLCCVDPDTLRFAFEVGCRGGPAEGCRLEVTRTPLVVACMACGHEGEAEADLPVCPRCGSSPVRVVAGRELRLVGIDVDDDPE